MDIEKRKPAVGYINSCKDKEWKALNAGKLDEILADRTKAQIVAECRAGNKVNKGDLASIIVMGEVDMELYKAYEEAWNEVLMSVPEDKRDEWRKDRKNKKKGSRAEWFLKPTQLFMADIDHYDGDIRMELRRIADVLEGEGVKMALAYVTASGDGGRVVCETLGGKTIAEDMETFMKLTGVRIDEACKDFSRLSYLTTTEDIVYRNDDVLFGERHEGNYVNENYGKYTLPVYVRGKGYDNDNDTLRYDNDTLRYDNDTLRYDGENSNENGNENDNENDGGSNRCERIGNGGENDGGSVVMDAEGNVYEMDYKKFNEIYLRVNNGGMEPAPGNRNNFLFRQACDYRFICDFKQEVLEQVLPSYGLDETERKQIIAQALSYKIGHMATRMRKVIGMYDIETQGCALNDVLMYSQEKYDEYYLSRINMRRMPRSFVASMDSLSPEMTMCVLTLLPFVIGSLATKVQLDVHGNVKYLNFEVFVKGSAGSGKALLGKLTDIWLNELIRQDAIYERQEDEWETKKRESEGSEKQPREIRLPRRVQTLRTTLPKIMQRLRDSQGQHLVSFASEADTLSENEHSFKILKLLLRFAYDNDRFQYDVKTHNSTNTTIEEVKWNVALCGTLDALYRLITNYTDGLLSRFAFAIMPDNRFRKLSRKHKKRSEKSVEYIERVAHLLPLMQGEVELAKIEDVATDWVNEVCEEAAKKNDTVMADLRIRTCVTAMRCVCCYMMLLLGEYLLKNIDDRGSKELPAWADGCETAEEFLKTHIDATAEMLPKFQTETMKNLYRTLADYFIDNACYLFRSKMEESTAMMAAMGQRKHRGSNDYLLAQLGKTFDLEECKALRDGNDNAARMMIRNWLSQGLISEVTGKKNTYEKRAVNS